VLGSEGHDLGRDPPSEEIKALSIRSSVGCDLSLLQVNSLPFS
jgi:hypothetical protein